MRVQENAQSSCNFKLSFFPREAICRHRKIMLNNNVDRLLFSRRHEIGRETFLFLSSRFVDLHAIWKRHQFSSFSYYCSQYRLQKPQIAPMNFRRAKNWRKAATASGCRTDDSRIFTSRLVIWPFVDAVAKRFTSPTAECSSK